MTLDTLFFVLLYHTRLSQCCVEWAYTKLETSYLPRCYMRKERLIVITVVHNQPAAALTGNLSISLAYLIF